MTYIFFSIRTLYDGTTVYRKISNNEQILAAKFYFGVERG